VLRVANKPDGPDEQEDSDNDEDSDSESSAEDLTGMEDRLPSSSEDVSLELYQAMDKLLAVANKEQEEAITAIPKLCLKPMALMGLKEREKGGEQVTTKAMSLRARYYAKTETDDDSPNKPRGLRRDLLVMVEIKEKKYYFRILAVFKKYHNKWYMLKPTDEEVVWNKDNQPAARVSLQRMRQQRLDGKNLYMPVQDNNKYTYIIRPVKAIQRVIGDLHGDKL